MEAVDVDDVLASLTASEIKCPRTKLLAYLESEGVAYVQTSSRQVKAARYGNFRH